MIEFLTLHFFIAIFGSLVIFHVSKLFKNLVNSPITRLIIYPLFFCFFGVFLLQKISINLLLIFSLEGYIFFQIVNLANTSRRIKFLFDFCPSSKEGSKELDKSHNLSRIQSLETCGVIHKSKGIFVVQNNLIYLLMRILSKLLSFASFENNKPR